MLGIFMRGGRRFDPQEPHDGALPEEAIWVDMHEPTPSEITFVERAVGIELPTREEMREIEASARVYEEGGALFLTATLLIHADDPPPATTEVTFILKGGRLITLRYADPQPFKRLDGRLARQGWGLTTGQNVFFWLSDLVVARIADVLERAALDVERLSGSIFKAAKLSKGQPKPDLLEAIGSIGRNGDTASKVRESLHTLLRIMLAVTTADARPAASRKDSGKKAKAIIRDVQSLTDQAAFLTQKINLLLDATLGMISIEQNAIIKIFSVAAVVFLPPTLIASIYGMNFATMPELGWRLGYPFAILLMIISAILPFAYFKRRGWL